MRNLTTVEDVVDGPVLEVTHHLRTNLALPMNDRLSFAKHLRELRYQQLLDLTTSLMEEEQEASGVKPPTEHELILAEFSSLKGAKEDEEEDEAPNHLKQVFGPMLGVS